MPVYGGYPSAPDPAGRTARGTTNARARIPTQRSAATVGSLGAPVGPGGPGKAGKTTGKTGKASKRPRRKDPLWARLVLIFGAVLMVTSGGVLAGSKAVISQATSNIKQQSLLGDAGKSEAEGGQNLDGPIDILMLGVDHRKSWAEGDVRADTIIILHIPASHDQAYLLSIPRDTEVDIPGHGTAKINAAFQYGAQNDGGWAGGTRLMAKTIKKLTGIKGFDAAAIINFGGFKKIIDALGSVHMCVDQEVKSHHLIWVDDKPMYTGKAREAGKWGPPVVYKKGCREMKGWEALDYARQRYGLPNGDYDRQRHQQQLIKAMAKKAMAEGMNDPFKLNKLLKAAGDALVLDTNGVPIANFIYTLKGLRGDDLVLLRTNGGRVHSDNSSGESRELLDETSLAMFRAVNKDKLDEFILYNPEVLVPQSKKK